jgi:hypothetical protein
MTWTAFGQSSTDSVTISRNQQRQCIKWYYDVLYRDSVIFQKNILISTSDERIRELETSYLNSLNTIDDQKTTIERIEKTKKRGWFTAGGVAVILALLLIF